MNLFEQLLLLIKLLFDTFLLYILLVELQVLFRLVLKLLLTGPSPSASSLCGGFV